MQLELLFRVPWRRFLFAHSSSCPFSQSSRFTRACACARICRSSAARIITLGLEKPSGEFAVHRLNKQAPRFGFSRRTFFPGSRMFESFPFFAASMLFPARVSSTCYVSSSILRLPASCAFLLRRSIISCSLSSLIGSTSVRFSPFLQSSGARAYAAASQAG